ncbi:Cytochrome c-type biogenesis protein CcmF [Aquicella siphonis]|uniref:Cytochrome c-type biogenesis protein CcmF n=1 Tax=Aquicella siphonis TaxID=254247 RepID=A0A5E4PET0_9COXI|nr:heme lyase CcmF/NrfE family subunit [Aquicella siphonis]VVC74871.1 Cytochrome c-type biogenesis protein CcmF [Aquicella siphonis]
MIRLFGEIALFLALLFALVQSLLPLWGYWRKNPHALACARPAALGQLICILAAYLLMTIAFAISDFSIAYVAANSHPWLPLMYRLTAVWGAHEGSILLWILILNIWTLAFSVFYRSSSFQKVKQEYPPAGAERRLLMTGEEELVLAVLGLISFSFLCFLLLTSNPFTPALIPQAGRDLNPLLQDPGFVIHPPMLYTGYVGFSVAFAITQAALIRGKLDPVWAHMTRRFALAAWCFLTFGITLGSWWAYRVLGWGGFWFWDPVENASLLPWLSGTALIHVLVLCEKRQTAKGWAALLAIISFALSLLGTFLVRSGVLISAHTFANDPARGAFLLLLLAILLTAALAVYVARIPQLTRQNAAPFTWASREMMLLLNSALLFVAMTTILLGTLYPLILDALKLGTISVGAPYFNKVMLPLVMIVMMLMGLGVLTHWQQSSIKSLLEQAWKRILLSILCAAALLYGVTSTLNPVAMISLSLSLWIIASVRGSVKNAPGMSLAHAGFAILVIGILLSSLLNQEREVRIRPGNETTLGPYQFHFLDTKGIQGSNFRGIQAAFAVEKNRRRVTTLYPEKRIYTVREMVMTKVDIHPSLFRDLYIALGEPLDDDYWSVRLYYKPFIRWIWFGGLIMILGGILAILQRKDYLKAKSYGHSP